MRKSTKGCIVVILFLFAIILITVGLVLSIKQTLYNSLIKKIRSEKLLIENTRNYKTWSSPMNITLSFYLFHVENPDGVMLGELPQLIERGPYVYDLIIEKEILSTNELRDEISYNMKKTYYYNEEKSGELSENNKIVLLNMAYLGAINTLGGFSLDLLKQYGEVVALLFPEKNPMFIKTTIKDILFDGISFSCDVKKHVKMKMICMTLKGRKPPILWNTDVENQYMYSLFGTINGTWIGPITSNRGVRDPTLLGAITSLNNKREQKYWHSEKCNAFKGFDGYIFPSYDEPPQRFYFYNIELCRSMFVEYQNTVKYAETFDAWRYTFTINNWSNNESDCYCPVIKKEKYCPPSGLMNADKCMKIPVFISEPHFLHADPELLRYASDLNPNEELHSSHLLMDEFSGYPFEGSRKSQVNMKIASLPVDLLANVTEGYFPFGWMDESAKINEKDIELIYMIYGYRRLVLILQWLPAAIGVFLIILILICYKLPVTRKKIRSIDPKTIINPNFVSTNSQTAVEYLHR